MHINTTNQPPEHTPGPYYAKQSCEGLWEVAVSQEPFAQAVAFLTSGAFIPGTAEGNARLLAAAPAMLEALQDIYAELIFLVQNSEGIMGLTESDHNPTWGTCQREVLSAMPFVKDAIEAATGEVMK